MRHAIPHKYDTIDGRKMQEEIARKIDISFTMCMGGANWESVLAEANFGRMREMVEPLRLYHLLGLLFAIVNSFHDCFTNTDVLAIVASTN